MRKHLILAMLLIHSIFTSAQKKARQQVKFKDGKEVIATMHKAYEGDKWYRNFTFSQETKFYDKDGKEEKTEFWHEASSSPGKLLIKIGSKDSKNGVLVENGKVHIYREGKEPIHRTGIHDLSLAAFDVYFLDPSVTTHLLDSMGYNLKMLRQDVFDGRKVFVIGAPKNDSTTRQLWIDAERFYLHRIIYPQGKTTTDAVFSDYQQMRTEAAKDPYWVATKMIFKQNGKLGLTEKYFDIEFPKEFPKETFDPEKFNEVILK